MLDILMKGYELSAFFQVQVRLVTTSRVINWKEKKRTLKRAF